MATAYVVETKGGQSFGQPHHRNETKKGWKDSHGATGCHAPTGKGKSFVLNKISGQDCVPYRIFAEHKRHFGEWTSLSRHPIRLGKKQVTKDLRELIFRMVTENPTLGAPRIHGKFEMLGFGVSERTVSRWVQRVPPDPEQKIGGRLFSAITEKSLPRWTFSQFTQSLVEFSMASL